MDTLEQIWNRLQHIRRFRIHVELGLVSEIREGTGTVQVKSNLNVILFYEKGVWFQESLSFSTTLKWVKEEKRLSLYHLRYGANHPVFLFDLYENLGKISSVSPHLCGEDVYSGEVLLQQEGICLHYHVIGPKKKDEIHIHYF